MNRDAAAALAAAIASTGHNDHIERLIDLIGALLPHDLVTVVRYSATQRPEFVSYRNYSDAMVRKYLETYYVYDPFYAHWRNAEQPGVVALRRWAAHRGPYITEFLGQSVIRDEVGVLLDDGPGWCLGIFLDRAYTLFSAAEIQRLDGAFPVFAALHDLDLRSRLPGFRRTPQEASPGREPATPPRLPVALWPMLSARERQIVELGLAGYPPARIAARLGIAAGTVKNHRRRIYEKLDITTERELFLQYIDYVTG